MNVREVIDVKRNSLYVKLHKLKKKLFGSDIDRLRKNGVEIGSNVHIFNSYIDPSFPFLISIGNNTTLTDVKILAHDASTYKELGYTKMGKVTIGNNCFIGAKSVVLPGVTIGDNVIIGAGSIVTKDIPSNSVAAGNPCKVLKPYDSYIDYHKTNMSPDKIINKLPAQLSDEEKKSIKEKIDGIWYIK